MEIRATTLVMGRSLLIGGIPGRCAEHRLETAQGEPSKPLGKCRGVGKIFREEEEIEATILEWWEMLLYLKSLRQDVESDY